MAQQYINTKRGTTAFERDFMTILYHGFKPNPRMMFHIKGEEFLNKEIEELNLSPRSYNGLARARLKTIGDIIEFTKRKPAEGDPNKAYGLMRIRTIGENSNAEIKNCILAMYYDTLNDAERKAFWKEVIS